MRIRNGAGAPDGGEAEKPDLQEVLAYYGCHAAHDGKHICLVHDEDNPSMNVSLREGLWHCHSCGAGGDAYTLIMIKEGVDFKDARRFAAQQSWKFDDQPAGEEAGLFGRRRPSRERRGRSRPWSRPW